MEQVITPSSAHRDCTVCDRPIPAARLRAKPDADTCVPCLEAQGDVVRIKRFDEYLGKEGEDVVSTYYTIPNQYLAQVVSRDVGSGLERTEVV